MKHREGFYAASLAIAIRDSIDNPSIADLAPKVLARQGHQFSEEDYDHAKSEETPTWLRRLRSLGSHRALKALGVAGYDEDNKVFVGYDILKEMTDAQIQSFVNNQYNADWTKKRALKDTSSAVSGRPKKARKQVVKTQKKARDAAAAVVKAANPGVSPAAKAAAEAYSALAEEEAAAAKAEAVVVEEAARVAAAAAKAKALAVAEEAKVAAEEAEIRGTEYPPKELVFGKLQFQRDQKVSKHVKKLADGKCACCGKSVSTVRGRGFIRGLVSHHIIFLSEGGWDKPENMVALCHNCHDEAHLGGEESKIFREEMYILYSHLNDRAFNFVISIQDRHRGGSILFVA